jgi:hypothetical protein
LSRSDETTDPGAIKGLCHQAANLVCVSKAQGLAEQLTSLILAKSANNLFDARQLRPGHAKVKRSGKCLSLSGNQAHVHAIIPPVPLEHLRERNDKGVERASRRKGENGPAGRRGILPLRSRPLRR